MNPLCRRCHCALDDHETTLCDRCVAAITDEGRSVRQAPVRPTRTPCAPSGATVALLVLGAVLAVVAFVLPQGAGLEGENVLALWCGVGAGVAGLWGLVKWDGER